MKNSLYKRYFLPILIIVQSGLPVKAHNLKVRITNQPNQTIILGQVKGDKFTATDSCMAQKGVVQFQLNNEYAPCVYRLILGQTVVARVMKEPPQHLDFIYNGECIEMATNFHSPTDSIEVIESKENKAWFGFLKQEKLYSQKIKELENEINYFQSHKSEWYTPERKQHFYTTYERTQIKRDSFIIATTQKHHGLFAARLMKLYREPFLNGNLSQQKRKHVFKAEYLSLFNFKDENLLHSQKITNIIFRYLMSYAQKGVSKQEQELEFMNAIDTILAHTAQNQTVYEFVLDYLLRGFEKLQLDNLLSYIADNYTESICQTDEKTTLERRLKAQKLQVGNQMPDFTIQDLNGDLVTLSDIAKKQTILIFWASWCPHCSTIFTHLKNWYAKQNKQETEVVCISLDSLGKDWKREVNSLGIESFLNLSELKGWDGKTIKDYNVFATPTFFILNDRLQIVSIPKSIEDIIYKRHRNN